MKNIFYLCLLLSLTIAGCTKEGGDGDGGGGNSKSTQELRSSDFQSDLTLENRNDGVDYVLNDFVYVTNALTIKPGVVIEFAEGAGLDVTNAGSIEAIGLPSNPITFTGKIKAKGAWLGILVQTTSLRNKFKHCIIEFAGGDTWGNGMQGGISTWAEAALNIDDCTFKSNKAKGLCLYASTDVDLRSFENNKFENNDASILIDPSTAHQLGTTSTFADDRNVIEIHENNVFDGDDKSLTKTWKAQPIPYLLNGYIDISGTNNLTIAAGATLEFTELAYIFVGDDASFTCKGTAQNPILLTGEIKSPGSWGGIEVWFTNSSKNVMEYTTVEYAGGNNREFENGAIYLWADPTFTIKNCTFKNNKSCIINAQPSNSTSNLTQSDNTLTNSGSLLCQ